MQYTNESKCALADNAMCVCSEIQPLETRAAACSFNVAVNMLFTFVIGQCFVTMLCSMQWGVFLFFAGKTLSVDLLLSAGHVDWCIVQFTA